MSRALKKIEPELLDAEKSAETPADFHDIELKRLENLITPLELDQPKEVLVLFSFIFIVAIGCLFSIFLY